MIDTQSLALNLRQAQASGQVIAPLRTEIGVEDLQLAYDIQRINIQHRLDNGAHVTGKKIGLTSFAVQKQLGVDQPDFGVLLNDMEVLNGYQLSMKDLMQPKAEGEVAFVLGDDITDPNVSVIDLIEAIDYVLPAIEIVGSRVKDWDIRITDTIADNASASHYVLGHTPKLLYQCDVIDCEMNLYKNGDLASTGVGSNCMGSPLNAMLWLAKKMIEMNTPLQAGEIVLSGALGPMVEIKAGDQLKADFGDFGKVYLNISE